MWRDAFDALFVRGEDPAPLPEPPHVPDTDADADWIDDFDLDDLEDFEDDDEAGNAE